IASGVLVAYSMASGFGASKTWSVRPGLAIDHMVKKANQEKNWTTPNLRMVSGISEMFLTTSLSVFASPAFYSRSARNASRSSGGYSSVVKTVYKMDKMKTMAPTANAICTDMGTTPGSASLLTPSLEMKSGRFEATQVLIPMMSVCTTNPKERWLSGSLSATKARNGSMEMFIEASRIHKPPAAIHKTLL